MSGLTCNPTSLGTGATSTCTATLSKAAGTGGVAVALTSNAGALTVPVTVTVPSGNTSATFTATAGTISNGQTATVTASLNNTPQSAAISLVTPTTITSLACSPASLASSSSTTCTATISKPAPSGGGAIALSSSSRYLTLPASATVPGSSTSATFAATAAANAPVQTVVLTATLAESTRTASVAITGPPTISVGPGQTYTKPCQAFAAAPDGALIQIDPSGNYKGDVCAITANNLTIRGLDGRAKIDAAGQNSLGKGIWVIQGSNTTVENIEFTGASVPDHNGAAIRQEGPGLTVRNCYFHNNEEGILAADNAASKILIEYSEFGYNGYGDGQTHNIYINTVAKFTLQYSYSHHAVVGHLVKSRAVENDILYNRLSSEATGTTSYEFDLPNGGKSFIIGNVIERAQALPTGHFSAIWKKALWPGPGNRSLHCQQHVRERWPSGTFVSIAPADTTRVLRNNIFYGPGAVTTQSTAIQAANLTQTPIFLNASNYDYRLAAGSPAIDTGATTGIGNGVSLTPVSEYLHPACGELRGLGRLRSRYRRLRIQRRRFATILRPPKRHPGFRNPQPEHGLWRKRHRRQQRHAYDCSSSGGAVITLASSNPNVASVPASVTVPSGALTTAFTIQTTVASTNTAVTISASYAGAVQSTTLTVSRPKRLFVVIAVQSTRPHARVADSVHGRTQRCRSERWNGSGANLE